MSAASPTDPGLGASLSYAPASGAIDPGAGITGFVASTNGSRTAILLVTLSAATTFAGLPIGADTQEVLIAVISGNYTLTLTCFGTTAGAQIMASGTSYQFTLYDAVRLSFSATAGAWLLNV